MSFQSTEYAVRVVRTRFQCYQCHYRLGSHRAKTGKRKLKGGVYAVKGNCGWHHDEMLIHYNIKNGIVGQVREYHT